MSIFIEGHESRSDSENLSMKAFRVIFGTSTKAGKRFDVILLWAIILSVGMVMLESVSSIRDRFESELNIAEWFFTILFSLEYLMRIVLVKHPLKYMTSFYGIVDLLSIIPSYLAFLLPGGQSLRIVRMLRLLRVFRVLKLIRYVRELRALGDSLLASRQRIAVFLVSVFTLAVLFGTVMYIIEDEAGGFDSIPKSIYWAIVTLTTVGYGDISPQTGFGQFLASMIMLMGYAIIAVPTGLVTADFISRKQKMDEELEILETGCKRCGAIGHASDARYCRVCAERLGSE